MKSQNQEQPERQRFFSRNIYTGVFSAAKDSSYSPPPYLVNCHITITL